MFAIIEYVGYVLIFNVEVLALDTGVFEGYRKQYLVVGRVTAVDDG